MSEMDSYSETGYEKMKRLTAEKQAANLRQLENLATNYYNDPMYIATEAFRKGLHEAVLEIEGWERLQTKAFNELPFANPSEAEREHKNTMNLLAVIKSKISKKIAGEL